LSGLPSSNILNVISSPTLVFMTLDSGRISGFCPKSFFVTVVILRHTYQPFCEFLPFDFQASVRSLSFDRFDGFLYVTHENGGALTIDVHHPVQCLERTVFFEINRELLSRSMANKL